MTYVQIVYSQPYVQISRIIKNNHQFHSETEDYLNLYKNKIITKDDCFLLKDVLDISYKELSTELCILYLHTTRGIFTYKVKSTPTNFVKYFFTLKK